MTALAIAFSIIATLCIWYVLRHVPSPQLVTSSVLVEDVEDTVVAMGALEASQMVSVGAQASGQIKLLKVQLGDFVEAGDLIAEIDSTTQLNELRNAQAAVGSTRAQRAVQVAVLKQARLAFERQKTMLEHDATSRADYESAEAALGSVRAQIEALDAQIQQGVTTLGTAEANLGYTKITAPMKGTVVAVVAKEGQTVNANQATPTIVKLANLDTMTVSAKISEADVAKVKPGQKVYFSVLGNPNERYYGKLRAIEPAPESIESETSTGMSASSSNSAAQAIYYNSLFEVPNPTGELRISMTALVSIVLREATGVLTIPSAALGEQGPDGRFTVKVMNAKGMPENRRIRVGINNNVIGQVLEGLKAGEKVVVGDASATPVGSLPP